MSTTCAIYVRQSLDRTGQGAAIERQEKEARALAKRLGLKVTAVHADNDTSATSGVARPGFDALLASSPPAIVVWHIDRLTRTTRDLERVIDLGIPVHAVTAGHVDLSTPSGRAVARTITAWSTYEGEQKSERQKASHRQRRSQGRPWTTRRAYGYEPDGVTIRPGEADVVARMYGMLVDERATQADIARWLNAAGHTTTLGNPWRQSSVRALLVNARNAGLVVDDTGEVLGSGAITPIISEERWRAACALMAPVPGKRPGGRRVHLGTGLYLCGVCGSTVRHTTSMRGQGLYSCRAGGCVARDAIAVDALVSAVVVARLSQPDAVELLYSGGEDDARAEADDARSALVALAEAYADGVITAQAMRAGSVRAQARLDAATASMSRSTSAVALAGVVGSRDIAQAWDGLPLASRRAVIDTLMTVAIDRTRRGARFDPASVRVVWKG